MDVAGVRAAGGVHAVEHSVVENCLIEGNVSTTVGGVYLQNSTIRYCTVVENYSTHGWPSGVLGWSGGEAINCVIWSNRPPGNATLDPDPNVAGLATSAPFSAFPQNESVGAVTSWPAFKDFAGGDYHLLVASPCIDAGMFTNAALVDLDGLPRVLDGDNDGSARPDMGAFEYVHALADSDGDGLVDTNEMEVLGTSPVLSDTDGDQSSDGDEVLAGTDPLVEASTLSLMQPVTGMDTTLMSWQTVFGKGYYLQATTNLVSGEWTNVWPDAIYELDESPTGTESFLIPNSMMNSFFRIVLE